MKKLMKCFITFITQKNKTMEQDLFNTPELLPQKVRDILAKYDEMGTSYDTCNNLVKELEQVGYTCDYGLDGIPYELTTIKNN